jgi:hypothetical protein
MRDAEESLRRVEYFSEKAGVAGFMVESDTHVPIHHNRYARLYRALEERDMPIALHGGLPLQWRIYQGMDKLVSVHSIAFVLSNMIHLTNFIMNGIPERFPRLKILLIESGLAWLPFMAQRLDNEYLMRSSEAPLLKKKPSDYIRENFYYSTQPIELTNLEALEVTMKMIGADTQLMFSSDWPHWDFNLPSTITDLPFLSETAKRNILGLNAKRVLHGLRDAEPVKTLTDEQRAEP